MLDALERLRSAGETLSPELRAEILSLGHDAVAPLLEILESGDDWVDIHAIDLLVDLRATEAIRPMLDVLAVTDFEAMVHDRIVRRLPNLGAAVLEPAFEMIAREEDVEFSTSVACVVANLGVRDERILELIYDTFEDDLALGAMLFADYGDRSALEDIEAAIYDYIPNFSAAHWRHELDELFEAHTQLGGAADAGIAAHIEEMDAAWRTHLAATARVGTHTVGRKD